MCLRNEETVEVSYPEKEIIGYKIFRKARIWNFSLPRPYYAKDLFSPAILTDIHEHYKINEWYSATKDGFHVYNYKDDTLSEYFENKDYCYQECIVALVKTKHMMTIGYEGQYPAFTTKHIYIDKIITWGRTFDYIKFITLYKLKKLKLLIGG